MKKIIAFLLSVVLCFLLCSCGNNDETIRTELDGSVFICFDGESISAMLDFDYDVVKAFGCADEDGEISLVVGEKKGTYKIKKDRILIFWDDKDCEIVKELYFTFEKGELKLYLDKHKENELRLLGKNKNSEKNESTTQKNISKEKVENIAKQRIINLCCDKSCVATVSIDYGTFNLSESSYGGYDVEVLGTYKPKDDYGMYGDRMKFKIKLTVDNYGYVSVRSEEYSSAY